MASEVVSLVARRIKEIREAKRMSRQQLAAKLDASYLQIYRIETGVTDIPADDVPRYADALEVSVASFYRESKSA